MNVGGTEVRVGHDVGIGRLVDRHVGLVGIAKLVSPPSLPFLRFDTKILAGDRFQNQQSTVVGLSDRFIRGVDELHVHGEPAFQVLSPVADRFQTHADREVALRRLPQRVWAVQGRGRTSIAGIGIAQFHTQARACTLRIDNIRMIHQCRPVSRRCVPARRIVIEIVESGGGRGRICGISSKTLSDLSGQAGRNRERKRNRILWLSRCRDVETQDQC